MRVWMTADIRKYDAKAFGPFNKRQLICVIAALVVAIPVFFIPVSIDNKILISLPIMLPICACGWVHMDGMYFETLAIRFLYRLMCPVHRKNIRTNIWREQLNDYNRRYEKHLEKKMTEKERKEYQQQKKSTAVKYTKKIYR